MLATDILLLALALLVFNIFISVKTWGLKKALLKSKSLTHIFHLLRVSLPLFVFRYIVLYVLVVRLFINFESSINLAITIVVSLATLSALCFAFTQGATGCVISKDSDFFNRADTEHLKSAVFSSGLGFFQATIHSGIGFVIAYGAYNLPEFRENFDWMAVGIGLALRVIALIFFSITAMFSVRALETVFLAFDRELFDWPLPRPWWANKEYTDDDIDRTIQKTLEKHKSSEEVK